MELVIAVARRVTATMSWHFFDDAGTVSLATDKGSAEYAICHILSLLGMPAAPEKHVSWGSLNVHLGVVHDMTKCKDDIISFPPKPGRINKIVARIESLLKSKHVDSGEAASLRGEIGYTLSSSFDRVGRVGLKAVSDRQYEVSPSWNAALESSLSLFRDILPCMKPRPISLHDIERTSQHGSLL